MLLQRSSFQNSHLRHPNPFSDMTSFVFPLLNINPEGKLQREVKDIVDELDIMLLINRQQLEVIEGHGLFVGYFAYGVGKDVDYLGLVVLFGDQSC